MNRRLPLGLGVLLLLFGLASCDKTPPVAIAPPVPTAPEIQLIKIPQVADASGDWAKQAHQVLIMSPSDNSPGADVQLALAWTPQALLIQVTSDDATPSEGDSVEVFYSPVYGSQNGMQHSVWHVRSLEHPLPRGVVVVPGSTDLKPAEPEIHARPDGKGYVMTVRLPWTNWSHPGVNLQPEHVVGVQVVVNDAQPDGIVSHRTWFPDRPKNWDPPQMQRVQLAAQADPPEDFSARLDPQGFRDLAVEVTAVPELAGKPLAVWSDGKQIATGTLASATEESSASITLPHALAQTPKAQLIVTVDGRPMPAALTVPDLSARFRKLARALPLAASASIFDTSTFPKIDFLNPEIVRAAVGGYTLHTRFFDAAWNEVTAPKEPGRYGALVECKIDDGPTFTKQITLYKTPQPYVHAKDPYDLSLKFPAAFGLPADLSQKEAWNINNWTGYMLRDFTRQDDDWAALIASLHDMALDPARWHGFQAWRVNDTWWAELQKRLGQEQDYHYRLTLPAGYDQDTTKKWPLLMFLHGTGERGDDLTKVDNQGPLGFVNKGHSLPFILVTPQCPEDQWWDSSRLAGLVDQVSAKYRVDPKRLDVTGLSMGGYGTIELVAMYPDKFTAIAPLSGGGNPAVAARIKKIPAWVFHGSEDAVVPTRLSVDLVHALQQLGAPVKLTIYPGVGHGGWDVTYSDPALYAWFLQQSR